MLNVDVIEAAPEFSLLAPDVRRLALIYHGEIRRLHSALEPFLVSEEWVKEREFGTNFGPHASIAVPVRAFSAVRDAIGAKVVSNG